MEDTKFINLIEKVEIEYDWCFSFLMSFKNASSDLSKKILDFQPRLAEILLDVMNAYKEVHGEEKKYVAEKCSYTGEEFSLLMNRLSEQKDQLKAVIEIGKSLGDGFAWFFYRNSNKEVHKHLTHGENPMFVSGIGAAGEIAFIKNNQIIDGYFVVYHSITSMLRIGDFSLCTIDGRVLGIGELKTRQDGNQLQISTYLSSKVDIPKSSVNKVVDDFDLVNPEPNRLKRELEMQEELLKLARASKNLDFFDADYNFSALENAYKYSKHTAVSDDNGLAVVLLKYGERIRDYLFADKSICENFSYDKEEILKIVSHESNYNSIHFTQIKTDLVGFRRSVIWWPISEGIIRGLVMRTIEVFNWVNLAYWCDELVRLGYNVVLTKTEEPQPEYRISKEYNNKLIHFKSPEMIIDLMLHDYLTWKSAAATLNRFFEEAKVDLKENMIIEIAINQRSI